MRFYIFNNIAQVKRSPMDWVNCARLLEDCPCSVTYLFSLQLFHVLLTMKRRWYFKSEICWKYLHTSAIEFNRFKDITINNFYRAKFQSWSCSSSPTYWVNFSYRGVCFYLRDDLFWRKLSHLEFLEQYECLPETIDSTPPSHLLSEVLYFVGDFYNKAMLWWKSSVSCMNAN